MIVSICSTLPIVLLVHVVVLMLTSENCDSQQRNEADSYPWTPHVDGLTCSFGNSKDLIYDGALVYTRALQLVVFVLYYRL